MVSGDIFGIAEQAVERALGVKYISAAVAGASGDIDPMAVVSGFDGRPSAVPETVRMGVLLGDAVLTGLRSTKSFLPANDIRSFSQQVMLPRKEPDKSGPVNVIAARLGDIALLGVDCEALVEVGKEIKRGSPFAHTLVITNCNGWSGYLPPGHPYKEGGYEVTWSGFGLDAAGILVKQAVKMLSDLRK